LVEVQVSPRYGIGDEGPGSLTIQEEIALVQRLNLRLLPHIEPAAGKE
jgi:hypothetical protein